MEITHESHVGPFPLVAVRNMEEAKSDFILGKRNVTKSVVVIMPTKSLFWSTIGIFLIPFFNMIFATFSTVVLSGLL